MTDEQRFRFEAATRLMHAQTMQKYGQELCKLMEAGEIIITARAEDALNKTIYHALKALGCDNCPSPPPMEGS